MVEGSNGARKHPLDQRWTQRRTVLGFWQRQCRPCNHPAGKPRSIVTELATAEAETETRPNTGWDGSWPCCARNTVACSGAQSAVARRGGIVLVCAVIRAKERAVTAKPVLRYSKSIGTPYHVGSSGQMTGWRMEISVTAPMADCGTGHPHLPTAARGQPLKAAAASRMAIADRQNTISSRLRHRLTARHIVRYETPGHTCMVLQTRWPGVLCCQFLILVADLRWAGRFQSRSTAPVALCRYLQHTAPSSGIST